MPETVILDFIGDPSGLKPVADALTALGKLTDEQQKDFAKANDDFKRRMQESANATKVATSSVEKLSTGAKELSKTFAGAAIKDATKDLNKFTGELVKAGKEATSMKAKLRELERELQGLDEGSEKFQSLSIEAAKLKDRIGDVSERIRVLASDTFAIDAVVDGVRGLTAAFTIAQSASALFGKENEDLQKALLKVQAASGLLMGVQEIANQLTGQGAAKLAVLSAAQKAYTFVVGATTGALKAMRIALAGLGIGAIIFVIYEAAKAFGVFEEAVKDNSEALEKQKAAQEEAAQAAAEAAKARQEQIEAYRKEVIELTKSQREQLEIDLKAQEQRKAQLEELLKVYLSAGEQIQRIQEEIRNGINVDFFEESGQADSLRSTLDELGRIQKEEAERINADLLLEELAAVNARISARKNSIAKIIKEENKAAKVIGEDIPTEMLENIREGQLQQLEREERYRQMRIEAEKKAADEVVAIREREADRIADLNERIAQLEEQDYQRAVELEQQKNDTKVQITEAAFQAIGMIINEAYAQQQEQIQATLNAELNALNEQQQAILSNESFTASQKEAIQKQFEQKEKEAKRKAWIAERNSKVEQALINGLLSFSLALATIPPPGGAITGAINLALAGVQAALIASKPVPAFELGTDNAPGGLAIVGEKGRELVVEPSGKKWLTPDQATLLDIKKGSQIIPNFRLDDYANMIPSVPADMLNQFEQNRTSTIDYGRLGKEFAKELGKNPMLSVSIDRNGVNLLIKKGNRSMNYLNNKFRN